MEHEFEDLDLEKVFTITISSAYIKGLIEINELLKEGIVPVEEIEEQLHNLENKEKEKHAVKKR